MGIFGGEKYSKEEYEETARSRNYYRDIDLVYIGAQQEAEERLRKLLIAGHKEAEEFNREYKKLQARAQEASQSLLDFEREKLGMHKKEGAEEADADKK